MDLQQIATILRAHGLTAPERTRVLDAICAARQEVEIGRDREDDRQLTPSAYLALASAKRLLGVPVSPTHGIAASVFEAHAAGKNIGERLAVKHMLMAHGLIRSDE